MILKSLKQFFNGNTKLLRKTLGRVKQSEIKAIIENLRPLFQTVIDDPLEAADNSDSLVEAIGYILDRYNPKCKEASRKLAVSLEQVEASTRELETLTSELAMELDRLHEELESVQKTIDGIGRGSEGGRGFDLECLEGKKDYLKRAIETRPYEFGEKWKTVQSFKSEAEDDEKNYRFALQEARCYALRPVLSQLERLLPEEDQRAILRRFHEERQQQVQQQPLYGGISRGRSLNKKQLNRLCKKVIKATLDEQARASLQRIAGPSGTTQQQQQPQEDDRGEVNEGGQQVFAEV